MAKKSIGDRINNGFIWFFTLIWKIIRGIFVVIFQIFKFLYEADQNWDSSYEVDEEDDREGLFDGRGSHLKLVISLASMVIKADGKVDQKELEYIRKKIEKDHSPMMAESLMMRINSYLKLEFNIVSLTKKVDRSFSQSTKIQLLHFLAGIATKDAMLTKAEFDVLKQISMRIRIPFRTLKSILALYDYITEEEAKQNRERKSRPKVTPQWTLRRAYTILEVSESASDKEVKKAYRKLAKLHHPDKVIHMGRDFQKAAERKFKQISEAYEAIKEKRGFA